MDQRGNLENCGGKNVRARLRPFHLNWAEPVRFGRSERTNGERPKVSISLCNRQRRGHKMGLKRTHGLFLKRSFQERFIFE